MQLSSAVSAYLRRALSQGLLAPSTIRTWGPNLRAFNRWLDTALSRSSPAAVEDISAEALTSYCAHLRRLERRPRTIKSHFSAIRSLCSWLMDSGAIAANPASDVRIPKLDRPERHTLTEPEVRAIIAACRRLHPERRRLMAAAMLNVLCCTAIRRSELLSLRVTDVDLAQRVLTVRHGKGDKRRRVLMPAECVQTLSEWIAERDRMKPRHNHLWAITISRRAGNHTLRQILDALKQIADLPATSRVQPHVLRRAGATHMHRSGMDLRSIQSILGHSDLATTTIYLFTEEDRLRETVELQGWQEARPAPQRATPRPTLRRVDLRRK